MGVDTCIKPPPPGGDAACACSDQGYGSAQGEGACSGVHEGRWRARDATGAATLRDAARNPNRRRVQPHATPRATLRDAACNPTHLVEILLRQLPRASHVVDREDPILCVELVRIGFGFGLGLG